MEFGIGYFPTHDAVGPGPVARLVQEHGHESLFFAEHTHIPASRESEYPGGGELPRKYSHTYDLFVALTAAAAATSTLRIGSGNFERIWSWPKPAQRPHPPVLVGGNGPTVLDRVLAFGDAWFPNYARGDDDLLARARELRDRAQRPIDLMMMGVPADAAVLERLQEAGCRRVVRWIPSGGRSQVEAALERWESAIAELTGEG